MGRRSKQRAALKAKRMTSGDEHGIDNDKFFDYLNKIPFGWQQTKQNGSKSLIFTVPPHRIPTLCAATDYLAKNTNVFDNCYININDAIGGLGCLIVFHESNKDVFPELIALSTFIKPNLIKLQ